jgi:hypothetical protein
MHARILLPTLFAATLLSTAALAERNDSDDRTPKSALKERVVRETRSNERAERVQKETPAKVSSQRAAPPRLQEKRGCATDDGGSCAPSRSERTQKSAAAETKGSKMKMPTKIQTQRGCATEDGSGCSATSQPKAADRGTESSAGASKHVVQKAGSWSKPLVDEMMRMRAKIEAERILDMLNLSVCTRKGTCGEVEF